MSEVKNAIEVLRGASTAELTEELGGKRAGALWRALRVPRPMDTVAVYVNAGWCLREVEFLEAALAPDEEVLRFDTWSATTNRRVIDRDNLRADARPGSWSRVDKWLEQFPVIPKR